jgi:hypothetical protein
VPIYTVHLTQAAREGNRHALKDMELVREGFSFPALIFSLFWLLWHRLWVISLIVFATYLIFISAVYVFHMHPLSALLIELFVGFFIALESSSLRRWTLARHDKPTCDVVVADNIDDAEVKAIARWLEKYPAQLIKPSDKLITPSQHLHLATHDVIGLFPEPQVRT